MEKGGKGREIGRFQLNVAQMLFVINNSITLEDGPKKPKPSTLNPIQSLWRMVSKP